MSHAVGIVGHVTRNDMVEKLAATVRPDLPPSIDDGTLGCERNHRRVWANLARDYPCARWAVVLEDDAVPVQDFDAQLEHALRVAPSPVVSLYLGRICPPVPQPAIAALVERNPDTHWLVAPKLLHAVGVAIRLPLVPAMLAHVSRKPFNGWPIDAAISSWAESNGQAVAYTWPSLVDHADEPTVIQRHADGRPRTAGRTAWRTGTHDHWQPTATALAI